MGGETGTQINTDISLSSQLQVDRANDCDLLEDFFVNVSLQAPECEDAQRKPMDLVVVLDKSGSMSGEKLKLCLETIKFLTENLTAQDNLAVVSYDTNVKTEFSLKACTPQGKEEIVRTVDRIRAGSMTNLSGGLLQGISELAKGQNEIQSVMLLTDGLANHGITQIDPLVQCTKSALTSHNLQKANIFTFGYGKDHSTDMLRALSDAGQGLYYFLEATDDIPTAFADCLGGLLSVVAQNITLELEMPTPAAAAPNTPSTSTGPTANTTPPPTSTRRSFTQSLSSIFRPQPAEAAAAPVPPPAAAQVTFAPTAGSPVITKVHTKKDVSITQNKHTVQLGDMYSEEKRDVLVQLRVPGIQTPLSAGQQQGQLLMKVHLCYVNVLCGAMKGASTELVLQRCNHNDLKKDPATPNREVEEQRARVLTALAMDRAVAAADAGQYEQSRSILQAQKLQVATTKNNVESYCNETSEMADALMSDLDSCMKNVSSSSSYASGGKCAMNMQQQECWYQRKAEVKMCSAPAKKGYSNRSKAKMRGFSANVNRSTKY